MVASVMSEASHSAPFYSNNKKHGSPVRDGSVGRVVCLARMKFWVPVPSSMETAMWCIPVVPALER